MDDNSYYPAQKDTIALDQRVIKSKAWLSLNGTAKDIYLILLTRRKMVNLSKRKGKNQWVCTNSKEIVFTYRDAENNFGISQTRFNRGIDALIKAGFIYIVQHGALLHIVTKYGLTDRWKKYGTPGYIENKRPKMNIKRGFIKPKNKNSIQ